MSEMITGQIKGRCKWARVQRPNDYGKYAISLIIDAENKPQMRALIKEHGLRGNIKEDSDDDYVYSFTATAFEDSPPPRIVGPDLQELPDNVLIGNGSEVIIGYKIRSFNSAKYGAGNALDYNGLQVLDLVKYVAKGPKQHEFKPVEGKKLVIPDELSVSKEVQQQADDAEDEAPF